jgi:hypothetical protein
MTPNEYIANELKAFVKRFDRARVRYEYKENANVHFVEILPSSLYNSESYVAWERELDRRFVALYPAHGICFISDGDDLITLNNPELTLEGECYRKAPAPQRDALPRRIATALEPA